MKLTFLDGGIQMLMLFSLILTAFTSAVIQSTSGFGFGIIFMAIMTFFLPYKHAAVLSITTSFFMQTYTIIKLHRHIKWHLVLYPAITSIIMSGIGLHIMIAIPERLTTLILGIFLWTLGIYLIVIAPRIKLHGTRVAGLITGAIGGFMDGVFAMGGPPMVAYYDANIDQPLDYEATIQTYFWIVGLNVLINNIACHNLTLKLVPLVGISVIGCLLGTVISIRLLHKISMQAVRRIAYIVMLGAGTYNLIKFFIFS